ncbi:MAG TPA: DUF2304 domain-containing protein [Nocardioidaceae bacterium]|nr:DUF2304 domain-containing protein [Nocardioidaceae bacterium]
MTANLVLGLTGSLVTLVVLFEMLRRHRLREKYAIFWVLVALTTLVIAVFPGVLLWAADLVGVEVPANLLFFGASLVLLVVSIHHSYELGRLEDRTRTLAEEVALLRMELEQKRRAPSDEGAPGDTEAGSSGDAGAG